MGAIISKVEIGTLSEDYFGYPKGSTIIRESNNLNDASFSIVVTKGDENWGHIIDNSKVKPLIKQLDWYADRETSLIFGILFNLIAVDKISISASVDLISKIQQGE